MLSFWFFISSQLFMFIITDCNICTFSLEGLFSIFSFCNTSVSSTYCWAMYLILWSISSSLQNLFIIILIFSVRPLYNISDCVNTKDNSPLRQLTQRTTRPFFDITCPFRGQVVPSRRTARRFKFIHITR